MLKQIYMERNLSVFHDSKLQAGNGTDESTN